MNPPMCNHASINSPERRRYQAGVAKGSERLRMLPSRESWKPLYTVVHDIMNGLPLVQPLLFPAHRQSHRSYPSST